MKRDNLKNAIKEKFGTITRFAELAGIDRYELQKAFMSFYLDKSPYKELRELAAEKCKEIDPEAVGVFLSDEMIASLRKAITDSGGLKELVKQFEGQEGFSRTNIYDILSGGRRGGKYKVGMTPTIGKLIDHFGIKV